MTVYPSRIPLARLTDSGRIPLARLTDSESADDTVLPAWLLATALVVFWALVAISRIEPFHYDGVGRHLTVAALFVAYMVAWKEIFRRYVA